MAPMAPMADTDTTTPPAINRVDAAVLLAARRILLELDRTVGIDIYEARVRGMAKMAYEALNTTLICAHVYLGLDYCDPNKPDDDHD